MIRNVVLLITAVALVGLLAACSSGSGGSGGPTYSEAEFDQAMTETSSDVGTVALGVQQETAVQALVTMPSGAPLTMSGMSSMMLSPQTSHSTLPRGVYVWDGSTWTGPTAHDDLVLQWSFTNSGGTSSNAELVVNWDGITPTVTVTEVDSTESEALTGAVVTLTVDNSEVGRFDATASWYACGGGLVAEATAAGLDGSVGTSSTLAVDNAVYAFSDTRMSTSGAVVATDGGNTARFYWDVYADGTAVRGGDCFLDDFEIDSGHVEFGTETQVDGDSDSMSFAVDYGNIVHAQDGSFTSADLANGAIQVNGATAVTFAGTFDDAGNDGVPGENVTVRFSGGATTTLEAVILDAYGVSSAVMRISSFLR